MAVRRLLLFLLTLLPLSLAARVQPAAYGLSIPVDSLAMARYANARVDSLVRFANGAAAEKVEYAVLQMRPFTDRTPEFYLLLCLVILLGIIRTTDPKYFFSVVRAFRNPSTSTRHLRDQLQSSVLSNLLMNLFFAITCAAYIFYLMRYYAPLPAGYSQGLWMLLLSAGVVVVYAVKYLVMRFSGWAFRVEEITEQYLFNVFLINKIIGMVILPFVVLLAFLPAAYVGPLIITSLVLIGILMLNRYTRSWGIFGSFFQFSRFHFFTYLCASEILPLAVLMKLLLQGWSR